MREAREKPFTTGKVAELCSVSAMTVWNWIKDGKLKAYRTPGGHFRVLSEDFRNFVKSYGFPVKWEKSQFGRPKRVMVVDDEGDYIELITTALRRKIPEVECTTALNGYDALIQIGHENPDLVILDLVMPWVDGFEVCRQLKSNPLTRHIAIIALSGYGSDINIARISEFGADFFLHKPFDLEELAALVRECLGLPEREFEAGKPREAGN